MDIVAAKQFVLEKLGRGLNKDLTYHSIEHTLDVTDAARKLGEMEGLPDRQICLIETAALFHDIGFTKVYDGHEKISVQIARETLPGFGYSQEDIETIAHLIMATEIPQNPQNHMEEILADADLDYIGRDDMFLIGQRLQYEWCLHDKINTLREWHEKQMEFLKKHQYFTKSAQKLREAKKQKNILELEELLNLKE
jgi:predicted metal-dependent HD superfamily phosphohydrolase